MRLMHSLALGILLTYSTTGHAQESLSQGGRRPDTTGVGAAKAAIDTVVAKTVALSASRDTTRFIQFLSKTNVSSQVIRDLDRDSPLRIQRQRKLYGDILIYSERFLNRLIIGTAGTFAGSGISHLEIRRLESTSPWKSPRVRNGFDKAKPWLNGVGAALVGVSLSLRSPHDDDLARKIGIGGATFMIGATVIKSLLGTNEDDALEKTAGMIDSFRVDIQQVELSRAAFDELRIRKELADDYYKRAQALLDTLQRRQVRLRALYTEIDNDSSSNLSPHANEVVALVDDIVTDFTLYESVAGFVDEYSNQLLKSYSTYGDRYDLLKPQFDSAAAEVSKFVDTYNQKLKVPFLGDLPRLRIALGDFRAAVKADAEPLGSEK